MKWKSIIWRIIPIKFLWN